MPAKTTSSSRTASIDLALRGSGGSRDARQAPQPHPTAEPGVRELAPLIAAHHRRNPPPHSCRALARCGQPRSVGRACIHPMAVSARVRVSTYCAFEEVRSSSEEQRCATLEQPCSSEDERWSSEAECCSSEEHAWSSGGACVLLGGARFHREWSSVDPPRRNVGPPRRSVAPRTSMHGPLVVRACSSEEHPWSSKEGRCAFSGIVAGRESHRCAFQRQRCAFERERCGSRSHACAAKRRRCTIAGHR